MGHQQHRNNELLDPDNESNEEDEEGPVFCPYTRESLIQSEARIAEEEAKRNERKKKREEGEVRLRSTFSPFSSQPTISATHLPLESLRGQGRLTPSRIMSILSSYK